MISFFQYGISKGFAIIMGLVLVGVIVYTIIAVRKQAAAAKRKESDPALTNLKERYERGEISRESYDSKKERLKGARKDRKNEDRNL